MSNSRNSREGFYAGKLAKALTWHTFDGTFGIFGKHLRSHVKRRTKQGGLKKHSAYDTILDKCVPYL